MGVMGLSAVTWTGLGLLGFDLIYYWGYLSPFIHYSFNVFVCLHFPIEKLSSLEKNNILFSQHKHNFPGRELIWLFQAHIMPPAKLYLWSNHIMVICGKWIGGLSGKSGLFSDKVVENCFN